jgi:Protein of unknown function (DUF3570)
VAATEDPVAVRGAAARLPAGAVLAAALALPGVMAPAWAENAPEQGVVSLRYLHYQDSQPDLDRIQVTAPSIYVMAPIGPRWSVEASLVSDSVSGASPRYHTAVSGASRMNDERHAGDVKVTRYENRSAWSMGMAASDENDYSSRAVSFEVRLASEDNNRSWNLGLGLARDRVGSTNNPDLDERKRSFELMAGVTQAWTASDLVQLNLTLTRHLCDDNPDPVISCLNDVYKDPDVRPRERNQAALLARWNHHFDGLGSTLRSSYRYYRDSYGIRAHTFGAEWVQPVGGRFTLTPSVRWYSQSAADFYFDPVYDPDVGEPYPPGYFTNPPRYISADQRLSAFGAVTLGLKAAVQLDANWSADIKLERYGQRAGWRLGGSGSPGLADFNADIIQVGVSRRF